MYFVNKYKSWPGFLSVMGGINLLADNKVIDTADQFIHMRLFLVINIRLMTYAVVVGFS